MVTCFSRRGFLGALIVASNGALLSACTVSASTPTPVVEPTAAVVHVAPPPPRYEPIPSLPPERVAVEYWQPGYWRWNGYEHVWVPGRYVTRPRPGATWVAGHWAQRGPGWVFIEGHWT